MVCGDFKWLILVWMLVHVFSSVSSTSMPRRRIRRQSWWWDGSSSSSSGYQDDECIQRCYNGGVCYNTNKCRCTSQYKGRFCEEAICDPVCGIRGTCTLPNVCQCGIGYEGKLCDEAICDPVCENGGNCTAPGECTCDPSYTGGFCEQAICRNLCLNGGSCSSPDFCTCKEGYTGDSCESAICVKSCQNGGSCIAPDICACAFGYLGSFCELGGDSNSFLIPTFHFTNEKPGDVLSWYEEEPLSVFGKNCLVKVELLNADVETLVTASSFTSEGEFLGNYTLGGANRNMERTGSPRAACLEFRCPSDILETKVFVNVTVATSRQTCSVSKHSAVANVQNQIENDVFGNQVISIRVQPHIDYGSIYGIYVTHGIRQRIQYVGEKMCRSGANSATDDIVPNDGTAITYYCK